MSGKAKINTFRNLCRLLGYTKRYWLRLTIGILCGMLVGGSLLVTLLMLPQMVGVMSEPDAPSKKSVTAAEVPAEKTGEYDPLANDPQLAKILRQAADAAESFHLPFTIDGTEIHVSWPKEFTFNAVDVPAISSMYFS